MILRIFLQFLKSHSPIVISYTKKNSCKYWIQKINFTNILRRYLKKKNSYFGLKLDFVGLRKKNETRMKRKARAARVWTSTIPPKPSTLAIPLHNLVFLFTVTCNSTSIHLGLCLCPCS